MFVKICSYCLPRMLSWTIFNVKLYLVSILLSICELSISNFWWISDLNSRLYLVGHPICLTIRSKIKFLRYSICVGHLNNSVVIISNNNYGHNNDCDVNRGVKFTVLKELLPYHRSCPCLDFIYDAFFFLTLWPCSRSRCDLHAVVWRFVEVASPYYSTTNFVINFTVHNNASCYSCLLIVHYLISIVVEIYIRMMVESATTVLLQTFMHYYACGINFFE